MDKMTKNEQGMVQSLKAMTKATSFTKASEVLGIHRDRLWRICNYKNRLYLYEYEYLSEKLKLFKLINS